MRWPGGNFVSGYHWQDGIGPKDQRPHRKDLAWGDVETNEVGTDEWLKFSKAVGAEPYICVNMGTGTLDEARNWVEYCNAKTGLYYSDLRAKNGHPDENNEKEQKVKTVSREINIAGDTFNYIFPAHSFTQIRIKIKA